MNNVFTEVKDLLTHNLRTSGIYIAFVAIILLFTILTGGRCSARRTSRTSCCRTRTS